MPPPAVRWECHASPHARLIGCFFVYCAATPSVRVGDNASVRLNLDSEPQPDACLFIDPKFGGHARLSDDDYIEGAPDLVAEVSSSSVAFDQNVKRQLYVRTGVREYVHWRVTQRAIDWYSVQDGEYRLIHLDPEGILKSIAFPGLWLNQKAMADEALPRVMEVLQAGIASQEHANFVRQLESQRQRT